MKKLLLILLLTAGGCAAQIGPEGSWIKYDICGFVGGVAFEAGIGGVFSTRLGCTDPVVETEEIEE